MKAKQRIPVGRTSALAILGSISGTVLAQTASSDQKLEEVIVMGAREALRDSIIMKQNTDLVSDSISTAEIGQLPDVTIAEELNRLPGVNTTRDRGNASQASIRGLGPRLVLGLVNGREVASSEPSQDLRWEIYPSEILSGAQVYKSQDASLVPGGIAATVDIRTLSPLNYKGPTFSLRAGPTYNDEGKDLPHYNGLGYRGSAGYVGHINDDFAVSLAASVQREKNGFPDFRTFGWNTAVQLGRQYGRPEWRRHAGQHYLGPQHRGQGSNPGSLCAGRRRGLARRRRSDAQGGRPVVAVPDQGKPVPGLVREQHYRQLGQRQRERATTPRAIRIRSSTARWSVPRSTARIPTTRARSRNTARSTRWW